MTCIFIIEFMIQYSLRDSARSLFAVLYLIGWLVLFFFLVRSSIVLVNTSAFTLKLSSLAWPLFIWHSSVSWVMRLRLGIIAIALRSEEMAGNLYGRVPREVSEIATGRSGIVMTVS